MIHPSEDVLLQYRFETLEAAEATGVAEHLRTCTQCAGRFAAIGKSVDRLGAYEVELDPALSARAVEQAKAQVEEEEAEPPEPRPTLPAWFGFVPGAGYQQLRRAASIAFIGCAVLLGGGEAVVALREVRTQTQISGERDLLAGGRSISRIQVIHPKSNKGIEDAAVRVTLVAASRRFPLFEGKTDALGIVDATLDIPNEALGAGELEITTLARGEEDVIRQQVTVGRDFKVHLSTDKPLYQPGQTIHVRALALESPALIPAKDHEVKLEVFDPKGNRLAGKDLKASRFGIAAWSVELASELALGEYKVSAQLGSKRTEVPVKVSRYTLPKFKMVMRGAQDTILAGETLRADLSARYFFGKPVGNAQVHAVLQREDGSLVGAELNGTTDKDGELRLEFELPSTLAAPGQPEALNLQVEVKDAAGQQEQKGQLFTVARELLVIEVFARHGGVAEGLPNTLYVLTTTPEGRPVPCDVTLLPSSGAEVRLRTGENGVGVAVLGGVKRAASFSVEANATGPDGRRASRTLDVPSRGADFNVELERALYRPGEAVKVTVLTRDTDGTAQLRAYKQGRLVHTQSLVLSGGKGQADLALSPQLTGSLELEVAVAGLATPVTQRLVIAEPGGLSVTMSADQASHRPGATAKLRFEVKDQAGKPKVAALGLSVVDESLWALTTTRPSQARAFFLLDRALQAPRGALSVVDLIAGRSFSAADQLAAQLLLSLSGPAPRADGFSQDTLKAETATLRQQRKAWDKFFSVAFEWFMAALGLLALAVMVKFAPGWFVPIGIIAATLVGMGLAPWRAQGEVLAFGLGAFVVAAVLHSIARKAFMVGYLVIPLVLLAMVLTFGDNIRRLFAMSADSLAGSDMMMVAGVGKKMRSFGSPNDFAEGSLDPTQAAAPPRREVRVRQHFPETMYVNPELVTDEAGVATLELPFADSITDWRLSALASSIDGALGSMNTSLRVFQDFFVDLDTPVALVRGDSASVPISVHNYLTTPQTIRLEVKAEDWFEVVGPASFSLALAAGEVGGQDVRIKVLKPGRHTLTVKADGTTLSDAVARPLWVTEAGQQKTQVVSGTLKANETTRMAITVPEGAVPGSTSLMLKVFPSQLASALDGLEGSLRAPHGCFEQTSSTTYPNVLVWDYLKRTGKKRPEIEERARGFVALGYQRLLSFEVPGGGFEWFGRAPANQVLTAYGLMEFKDMAQVFPVDEKLIQRTQDWLVSKQQTDGSWSPDQKSLSDGLWKSGHSGRLMVSAYIAWALVESGYQGKALAPALGFLAANLDQVKDAYTLSMVAATFGRAGHASTAAAVTKLTGLVQREKDLAWFAPDDATLYYSRGVGAKIESTALAAYALMVTKQDPELVRALLAFLAANRDAYGSWHSTQGTVLALRALLKGTGGATEDFELAVRVNGADAGKLMVAASADKPALSDLAASVKPGLNVVEVTGKSDAQFQVVALYTQPWREKGAAGAEPLTLKVDYGRTKTQVGGIVPVDLLVTYSGADASGMVVVSLGLPAGLSPLPEDLQGLVTAGAVARFEVAAGAVNLYLDGLTPKVPQKLALRLKAKSKVDTQGVGSSAWLYYHPAVRAVVAAIAVRIN